MDIDNPGNIAPDQPQDEHSPLAFLGSPSSFGNAFPLPLRIQFLVAFGLAAWATNLHILALLGIDTAKVLDVRLNDDPAWLSRPSGSPPNGTEASNGHAHGLGQSNDHTHTSGLTSTPMSNASSSSAGKSQYIHPSRLYPPIYALAGLALLWVLTGWCFYRVLGGGTDLKRERAGALAEWLPAVFGIILSAALIGPWDRLKRKERYMGLRCAKRSLLDGLYSSVPFCDVIFADILTSYAKVLGDVWVCTSIMFGREATDAIGGRWAVAIMTSLPYVVRLRQCLAEYFTTPANYAPINNANPYTLAQPPASTPSDPRTRALFNAVKYATAFPVIFLSAMQGKHEEIFRNSTEEQTTGVWLGRWALFNLWMLSVFANSMYSFWWDVTNDWGLLLCLPSGWTALSGHVQSAYMPARPATFSSPRHRAQPLPTPSNKPHYRSGSMPAARHSVSKSTSISGNATLPRIPGLPTTPNDIIGEERMHGNGNGSPPNAEATESSNGKNASGLYPPQPSYAPKRSRHGSVISISLTHVSTGAYPFLRPVLLLADPTIYYLAIGIDLLLRFTWSLKLSSHLHEIHEIEQGIFLMEALEVIRRWMWCFLRIEWEAVRKGILTASHSNGSNAGIPLSTLDEDEESRPLEPAQDRA
ncbi:uncharacterized protein L969DRAFT_92571 [Mixia osmundae IAM 14324]|uniref:EXS domain-containing protein n=1 Tax=Mixia osmundae (strain CBS 9802 / IAM 14324 / JCM 22182 / KY 12970) TaxID=764103 RepID=G7DXX5_MIXOS|nr:uncharacterized protein L969DRAFT_92571 [Mixia osmundae IAM 14324]KEI41339.1 hypothetical protein L969DRAFT_92571 [Mixia osmundae IAM 14324]GAA95435.1 hypothetical protein E5Q_02089 [Mixia osmundae IAM 14324]